jgi:hypothetical protein
VIYVLAATSRVDRPMEMKNVQIFRQGQVSFYRSESLMYAYNKSYITLLHSH